MKLSVLAVGRVRDGSCRALCDEYVRRVGRYGRFEVLEVRDARGESRDRAQTIEGERLLAKLPTSVRAVTLDERGKTLTSRELAAWLGRHRDAGLGELRLVVGGAWGLSAGVKARADESIRLSSMTFPHEIARVVLLEQLYRAWTLLRGEPYHH